MRKCYLVEYETLEYRKSLKLQNQIRELKENNRNFDDFLLVLQHNPIFTIGKKGTREDIIAPIDLLQNEIHVLVEKPMALNSGDCQAMIESAKNAGVVLAVGLVRRFYHLERFVKQVIDSMLLGKIIKFDLREGVVFGWPVVSDSIFSKHNSGGGVLIDIGVHVLDLLLWWFGNYETVEYYDDSMGGVEAEL